MYKRSLVFAAACMGMLLFGIALITLGSVAPDLTSKLKLDTGSAGTLFSILPLGILVGSIIFGPIADQFGYKRLMVLSCFGFFLSFEGIAFADSIVLLRITIFFVGFFGGIINGATNSVVADITVNNSGKGANLSLLGVFFGIGALGMPSVLRLLRAHFSFEKILASTGLLIFLVFIFYLFIKFPLSKKAEGFPLARSKQLFKEPLLILIGLYLFCQSSYEALINNWTTTYLTNNLSVTIERALLALSLQVMGLTLMRLLIGSVLRKLSSKSLLIISFMLLLVGNILLLRSSEYFYAVVALICLGMGLAGGFPVMLGIVGEKYSGKSGTAFSFVLLFALMGNMLLNYVMGQVASRWGIQLLPVIIFIELGVMLVLFTLIFKNIRAAGTNQETMLT
jgi:MFS family permease